MDILTVDTLAQVLQEPNRPLLTQVLRVLGHDRCAALLADTLQCEAHGGMLTKDETRRRTPGASFASLSRNGRRSTNAGASSPSRHHSTASNSPRPLRG